MVRAELLGLLDFVSYDLFRTHTLVLKGAGYRINAFIDRPQPTVQCHPAWSSSTSHFRTQRRRGRIPQPPKQRLPLFALLFPGADLRNENDAPVLQCRGFPRHALAVAPAKPCGDDLV